METNSHYYSKSKRFAVAIFVAGVLISLYGIYKGFPEVAVAVGPSFTGSSILLYANKQHQDRKKLEAQLNHPKTE